MACPGSISTDSRGPERDEQTGFSLMSSYLVGDPVLLGSISDRAFTVHFDGPLEGEGKGNLFTTHTAKHILC